MPMVKANLLVKTLCERKLTLALAESMTAGLASAKLSVYKGVADMFAGSVVCYTPEVKRKLLKVDEELINRFTCESQEVTDALAEKLSQLMKADIYAGITGLACAGGSETKQKPVGTVFFSIFFEERLYRERKLFRGTPSEIREKACDFLYEFILDTVEKASDQFRT